jgi:hypothetical protein
MPSRLFVQCTVAAGYHVGMSVSRSLQMLQIGGVLTTAWGIFLIVSNGFPPWSGKYLPLVIGGAIAAAIGMLGSLLIHKNKRPD